MAGVCAPCTQKPAHRSACMRSTSAARQLHSHVRTQRSQCILAASSMHAAGAPSNARSTHFSVVSTLKMCSAALAAQWFAPCAPGRERALQSHFSCMHSPDAHKTQIPPTAIERRLRRAMHAPLKCTLKWQRTDNISWTACCTLFGGQFFKRQLKPYGRTP